uniref:ADP-ribosylation factor-like protein 4C n=1 Tax=Myxine glutinosa TaxID=7769 RepID=UPI00358E161D
MGNSHSNDGGMISIPTHSLSSAHLHVVLLGLDQAGKTAALYRLKFGEFVATAPTIGFNTEKLRLPSLSGPATAFHLWDVGGQDRLRPLWRSYARQADGFIFVVDSTDEERLEEACDELQRLTRLPEGRGVPLLVLASKQDVSGALTATELEKVLRLADLGPTAAWHVEPTSSVTGRGLVEGLDKLRELIIMRRKALKQNGRQR